MYKKNWHDKSNRDFFLLALLTLISKGVKDQWCTGFVFLSMFIGLHDSCNLKSNFIGLCGFGIITFCNLASWFTFLKKVMHLGFLAVFVQGSFLWFCINEGITEGKLVFSFYRKIHYLTRESRIKLQVKTAMAWMAKRSECKILLNDAIQFEIAW